MEASSKNKEEKNLKALGEVKVVKNESNASFKYVVEVMNSLKAGYYEVALSKYETALQLVFDVSASAEICSAVWYANLGACFYKLGKFKETIKACTKALERNPKYIKALLRRGEAHEKLGHAYEAILDMRKVLKLDPSNKQARWNINRMRFDISTMSLIDLLYKLKNGSEYVLDVLRVFLLELKHDLTYFDFEVDVDGGVHFTYMGTDVIKCLKELRNDLTYYSVAVAGGVMYMDTDVMKCLKEGSELEVTQWATKYELAHCEIMVVAEHLLKKKEILDFACSTTKCHLLNSVFKFSKNMMSKIVLDQPVSIPVLKAIVGCFSSLAVHPQAKILLKENIGVRIEYVVTICKELKLPENIKDILANIHDVCKGFFGFFLLLF